MKKQHSRFLTMATNLTYKESINKNLNELVTFSECFFKLYKVELKQGFSTSLEEEKPFYLTQGLSKGEMDALIKVASDFYVEEQYEKAFFIFRLVAYFDYSDIRAWKGVAYTLCALKKLPAAIHVFSFILKKHPEDLRSLFQQAKCYRDLGDVSKAEATIEKVIALSHENLSDTELRQQAFLLKAHLPTYSKTH